jgi:hypothetical protein
VPVRIPTCREKEGVQGSGVYAELLADTKLQAVGNRELVREERTIKGPRHTCLGLFGAGG